MKLPLLKYYLASVVSMRLRLYLAEVQGGYYLEKTTLEPNDRNCLECLFYAEADACNAALLQSVEKMLLWLKAYLSAQPLTTLPPLLWPSTPFSLLTLKCLAEIPFGTTVTYGQLATLIHRPRAARTVGIALNKNPFPLILPCHRVVSQHDGVWRFAYPLSLKKTLLEFEKA